MIHDRLVKKLLVLIVLGVITAATVAAQQANAAEGYGEIRLTFQPFPYFNDPSGIDLRSYAQMGPYSLYVVRIYPSSFIRPYRQAMVSFGKMGMGDNWSVALKPDALHQAVVNGQPLVLLTRFRRQVLSTFSHGENVTIYTPAQPVVPFLVVPVPPGVYYLEYSLYFPGGRTENILGKHAVHPNYSDLGAPSIVWGPPKITVAPGQTVDVTFQPTDNFNLYAYNGPGEEQGEHGYVWENGPGMKAWLKFLVFIGALQ